MTSTDSAGPSPYRSSILLSYLCTMLLWGAVYIYMPILSSYAKFVSGSLRRHRRYLRGQPHPPSPDQAAERGGTVDHPSGKHDLFPDPHPAHQENGQERYPASPGGCFCSHDRRGPEKMNTLRGSCKSHLHRHTGESRSLESLENPGFRSRPRPSPGLPGMTISSFFEELSKSLHFLTSRP